MSARVTSNYPLIHRALLRLPKRTSSAIAQGLGQGLLLILGRSQRQYLSGPRPLRLGVVTTRLRNSLASRVKEDATGVYGHVGTNVRYGRFHEEGFHGLQQVRAHTRVLSVSRGWQTFGLAAKRGPIREGDSGRVVGYKRSSKAVVRNLKSGRVNVQFVRAHSRRIDYAGRPFLRPAILQERRTVLARIIRAVRRMIRQETGRGPTV